MPFFVSGSEDDCKYGAYDANNRKKEKVIVDGIGFISIDPTGKSDFCVAYSMYLLGI